MEGFFKGTQVSNYKILSLIGKGGMGEVYKAQHIHLETLAAIKILIKNTETDIGLVNSFIREARTAAQIKHSNVVEVYDVGETNAYWYLVMEYVPGIDCAKLIRTHRVIPIGDAVKIIKAAAKGLSAVHERGLVHRDIKPHNLYITRQLVVKVGDFGLVQYQKTLQELSNKIAGTPAYMAPEQVMDVKKIGPTTDIYSLGATFYQMLTGQQLFPNKSSHEILFALFRGENFPTCKSVVSEIPEELSAIVMKMLEREQYDRYQTMQEVIQALDDFEIHFAPNATISTLAGESLLTESAIQVISDSATNQSTHITPSEESPAEDEFTNVQEPKIVTAKLERLESSSLNIPAVSASTDRGGTEELSAVITGDSPLDRMAELGSEPKNGKSDNDDVANERSPTSTLPVSILQKSLPISSEVTFDESTENLPVAVEDHVQVTGKENIISSEATLDESKNYKIESKTIPLDTHLAETEEKKKPSAFGSSTMSYVKPSEPFVVSHIKLYIGIAITCVFLLILGAMIWMLLHPATSVTLQFLETSNENAEIRSEFELNEPIELIAIFEYQGEKFKPFLITIQGEGIESSQIMLTPVLNQSNYKTKIPLKLIQPKPGNYSVTLSYTFGQKFEHTKSFKLILPQFDLVLKQADLTNENGTLCSTFYQGEMIHLFLQWTISSRRQLPYTLQLNVQGAIELKKILATSATPNDYKEQVLLQKANELGEHKIQIKLNLENKICEKTLEFTIKKRQILTISSAKIVDRLGVSRPIFEYGTEVYLELAWIKTENDFDFLKVELKGNQIQGQIHQIPIAHCKTTIPISLTTKEPGKYGISVLVSKGTTLITSQTFDVEWEKPDTKLTIETASLVDTRKNQRSEFAFNESVQCRIQWRCADISKNSLKLRIINPEIMNSVTRELLKGNGELQEIVLPLNIRYLPGTYNIQLFLTLGDIEIPKTLPIKIRTPELASIYIYPANPKVKNNAQIKFTAQGYSKERLRVTFSPVWRGQGGTMRSDGTYTAGSVPGIYEVVVSDPNTNIEAVTKIEIMQVLSQIIITPNTPQVLQPGESIVLRIQGYTARNEPFQFTPHWTATGGNLVVGTNPYEATYTAGDEFNQFTIYVSDSETNISAQVAVSIELTGGWFGESLPSTLARTQQPGEYICRQDGSIMVYVPPDSTFNRGFYIDKYELSAGQFAKFVSSTGYKSDAEQKGYSFVFDGRRMSRDEKSWRDILSEYGANYPVVFISPVDMQNYAQWAGKTLPSRKQWIKAGGRSTLIPDWATNKLPIKLQTNPAYSCKYPWGNETYAGRCNICSSWETRDDDGFGFLAPITTFAKEGVSPFGCVNMAGNVYELTSDSILLGGAWCYGEQVCELAKAIMPPDISVGNNYVGTRFVLNQD